MDLQKHYSATKISYSLRTKSRAVASSRAGQAVCKLDEYWFHLRTQDADIPGKHLLKLAQTGLGHGLGKEPLEGDMKLSDAVQVYLGLKGKDKGKTFHAAAQRGCGYVIDACGIQIGERRNRPRADDDVTADKRPNLPRIRRAAH